MNAYQQLEYQWADWNRLDSNKMVVCSSGTAALHLALECVGEAHQTVAVPDFTMIACARACVLARLQPLFVDCDERLLIDVEHIPATANVVMAVHIYGRRCDVEAIHRMNRVVVEDMSEIHGTLPHPDTDAACWSFYKNKIIGGEEGGAVYFRKEEHAKKARALRSLGFTDDHDFMHIPYGHNYRLSNAHAQLVLDSLEAYHVNINKRLTVEKSFDKATPSRWRMPERDQPWVYDICVPFNDYEEQTKVVTQLREYGVRHGFKPMTTQEEFKTRPNANALRFSKQIIYFPLTLQLENVREAIRRLELVVGEVTNYSRH